MYAMGKKNAKHLHMKSKAATSNNLVVVCGAYHPMGICLLSFSLAVIYDVVAAFEMLSTITTGLSIDAYVPISDNAGGIAKMVVMSPRIRERTDALDAARNTTTTI
ncbi:pyrophosphate-energized vacuolar membrane proton pump-like protein [Tanacetum coccineum]